MQPPRSTPGPVASDPLISLVLPVKNAVPHLSTTMDALRRQTYRNFEVLVQDGGSSDGTLEYLNSVQDLPRIEIVSEPDRGVGQAYNRGIVRSKGDLICMIGADEVLDEDALAKGVQWFQRHPTAAVVYGGVRLVDETGEVVQVFIPPAFDLNLFLHNQVEKTFAGFFNRNVIGEDFYYDESLKTCPDFDFWIRLGLRFDPNDLVVEPDPIMTARCDRTSMSYRVESFHQFTKDKLYILQRYLRTLPDASNAVALRISASAGILTWAAESVFEMEGVTPEFVKWCREAAALDPHAPRLLKLLQKTGLLEIDSAGQVALKSSVQPESPAGPTVRGDGLLRRDETYSRPPWQGAVQHGDTTHVTTSVEPWGFSALIPIHSGHENETRGWCWVKLRVRVLTGEVGFSLLASDDLFDEKLVSSKDAFRDVYIRLNQPGALGVMVRTGAQPGPAQVEILDVSVEVPLSAGQP
jgi:glycosyl transferase family 2